MITEFKLFEKVYNRIVRTKKYNYEIGDIVYCIKLPSAGVFYTNRPYEIVRYTKDNDHIQVKDMTTGKEMMYWVLINRFIPEYEYDAKKYNL